VRGDIERDAGERKDCKGESKGPSLREFYIAKKEFKRSTLPRSKEGKEGGRFLVTKKRGGGGGHGTICITQALAKKGGGGKKERDG